MKRNNREKRGDNRKKKQEQLREQFLNPPKVTVIPAVEDKVDKNQKMKVAAYCRVSTYEEAQAGSFELQKLSYKEKIESNPDWELAGIYGDEGVSGTSMKNRVQFRQMISDCKEGKIQLIIVKSLSRFARNSVDFMSINRELKTLPNPVGIYLEDMNINTLDSISESFLMVASLIAQGLSEQKSAAITWSIIRRFEKGIPIVPTHNLLGYSKDDFNNIIIVEEEAEIVRFIYESYLSGNTGVEIANSLNSSKIPTVTGKAIWKSSSIYRILRNEKYSGDILMQKTYTIDYISHKTRKNTGQRPMYLLENGMPAIISKADWIKVQKQLLSPIRRKSKSTIKKIKPSVRPIIVKSGIFKGFITIDPQWSREDMNTILKYRNEEK